MRELRHVDGYPLLQSLVTLLTGADVDFQQVSRLTSTATILMLYTGSYFCLCFFYFLLVPGIGPSMSLSSCEQTRNLSTDNMPMQNERRC